MLSHSHAPKERSKPKMPELEVIVVPEEDTAPLSQRMGDQDPKELEQYLELVRSMKVKRYLEIGCRHGYTFYAVMRAIGLGGYGLAIDLGEAAESLATTINEINDKGYHAELVIGSSLDVNNMNLAKDRAPFDLVFIDGDHSYEGVRSDWYNYRDLAPVVALHDIAAPEGHMADNVLCGVPQLWKEIKEHYGFQEYVSAGSSRGFGVVFQ